ncbi:hypothetical protein V8F44DRAFT_505198, partial [Aspergillus fumigatus]
GSRAFLSTAQSGPGTGARRMSRGSRARPLLDAPNPVDSLDDPTRDAARRPLESRNHGWDGRLPPTTDLDRAMIVRANVPGSGSGWRGAHSVWGGPCVGPRAHTKWASQVRPLLGPQGDLVTRAVSRARPIARCGRARAPGLYRPRGLCVCPCIAMDGSVAR